MELIMNQTDFEAKLINEPLWVLFTTSLNCGVCHADLPRVQQIAETLEVPVYQLKIEQVPLLVGQLNLFAAPTLIIYLGGKEVHRQVRIIDFAAFKFRIEQYKQAITQDLRDVMA